MINKRDLDSHSDKRSAHKNQRRHKSSPSCRRRPLYVNFTKINYDEWIIAPEGYEVNSGIFMLS